MRIEIGIEIRLKVRKIRYFRVRFRCVYMGSETDPNGSVFLKRTQKDTIRFKWIHAYLSKRKAYRRLFESGFTGIHSHVNVVLTTGKDEVCYITGKSILIKRWSKLAYNLKVFSPGGGE